MKTPALILDRGILARNCTRMSERMKRLGVDLRPHLKTAKSARVAEIATAGHAGGITVSTLAEARYFAGHGYRDITYAVGIVPGKLEEVAALESTGVRLNLITDSAEAARGVADWARTHDRCFRMLIEVDTGGRRGGVDPGSDELLEVGRLVAGSPSLTLRGVLTHAGQSHDCRGAEALRAVAEVEREGITRAAGRLEAAGLPCPVVSAGSTPTALFAETLEGVTEMRPGAYVFFDLGQVEVGSCAVSDIALTVMASVIGHNRRAERIIIDAGSTALSKDRSPRPEVGYGLVCPAEAIEPIDGICVAAVEQEHGMIAACDKKATQALPYDRLPVGSRVRILPNHGCITAALHSAYLVVDGNSRVLETWDRATGW